MAPRPILGDIELEKVQSIIVDGDQVLVEHGIPALEGNFLQRLGRRATQINLRGFLTGSEVANGLKALRDKFRAAEPVAFVADIATATQVGDVLIEEMDIRELAGKPERFEYAFVLREFIVPPMLLSEEPPIQEVGEQISQNGELQVEDTVEDIADNIGDLRVEVELSNQNRDYTNLVILVEGVTESGEEIYFIIEEQSHGTYIRQNVPAGEYTASVFRR